MRNLPILLVLCFSLFHALMGHAQDRTFGKQRGYRPVDDASVLIVPYEPKMYIADVTRELCESNEIGVDELRRILREGLSQLVASEISKQASVIDLLNEGEDQQMKDINEIYSATNYDYVKVPIPDSIKTKKQRPDQVGRGTYLEGGYIKSYYDGKERFMDVIVEDKRILSYLKDRYDTDYIVFLNELDIRVKRSGVPMPGEQKDRQIKVHYSILDAKGKRIKGSAVMLDYPYGENNVFDIVREYFRSIAGTIALELFPEAEQEKPAFILPGR